ncbi:DMT family transporter [Catalinimonas niigatensis]|uniref:DMT family transporter n=1 Tax=Catalinimonas niigatensis TaxID=1397264 RepID=UPI002666DDAC|nr:DMT family transporter [Catalinimonas niigatensis]WPP52389.1 DMT family transporter [Catalinimonas niigatensis]
MQYIFLIFALIVGMGVIVQTGANTQLSAVLDNPYLASLISFAVGTVALLIINMFMGGGFSSLNALHAKNTDWWIWSGGVIGAFFVTSIIVMIPILGSTRLFALTIAGQLIFSVIVDHYGWMGFPLQPVNVKKILGVLLLIAGTFLVQWGKSN